ncbi:hypothetical protein WCLP8_3960011 [uncultured Gammaproteobacteria bacterium]
MTLERFAKLIAARGAALARWPHADQVGARRLLARSPEALSLLTKAAALDAALDSLPPPDINEALLARLRGGIEARIDAAAEMSGGLVPELAARRLAQTRGSGRSRSGRPAAFAGLFLMMIAIGFAAGLAGLDPWPAPQRVTTVSGLLALTDPIVSFSFQ